MLPFFIMDIDPYRLYEIITTVMVTTIINILWDILKNIFPFYKDRKKRTDLILDTSTESKNSTLTKPRQEKICMPSMLIVFKKVASLFHWVLYIKCVIFRYILRQ